MERIIYQSKEEALENISKKIEMSEPCLDMFLNDVYDVPMYFPMGTPYEYDKPTPFGTMKVKYKLNNAKPMISVGDWVIYFMFGAEIIDFELDERIKNIEKEKIKDMMFLLSGREGNKFSIDSIRFTKFLQAITYEVELFEKICNLGAYVSVDEVIWNA
jgi:hypothetical protein